MTLNLSRQTVVPLNSVEGNLASSVRSRYVVDGMSEGNQGVYGKARGFDWDYGKWFHRGTGGDNKSDCFESVGNDIIDLLPKDPFGMGEAPNDAMMFVLAYLGLQDLLRVDMVCRSFKSVIHTDGLLWRRIHIDESLKDKITDKALLNLSDRAQGNLQCLSLVGCSKITDNCLKRVLESNPRLTKLNVVGCNGLSVDGIVNNLKNFKSSSASGSGISHLRIGGRYGMTLKHFEVLKSSVGTENFMQPKPSKPHYLPTRRTPPSCDDDRVFDIDICPRCKNVKLVYDCPAESCTQICRACIICIPRCVDCGRCVNGSIYIETFTLEHVCSDCSP